MECSDWGVLPLQVDEALAASQEAPAEAVTPAIGDSYHRHGLFGFDSTEQPRKRRSTSSSSDASTPHVADEQQQHGITEEQQRIMELMKELAVEKAARLRAEATLRALERVAVPVKVDASQIRCPALSPLQGWTLTTGPTWVL